MWNYRIFTKEINGRLYYSLKEAYYDTDGKITSFTEDTITGYFEDLEDLEKSHIRMSEDIQRFKNKVLVEESFDFPNASNGETDAIG